MKLRYVIVCNCGHENPLRRITKLANCSRCGWPLVAVSGKAGAFTVGPQARLHVFPSEAT